MRWLWSARALFYGALAAPGFYTAYASNLMPPLLSSMFCTFACILNAVSTQAQLPTAKEWGWRWITPTKEAKKSSEDQGGAAGPGPLDVIAK